MHQLSPGVTFALWDNLLFERGKRHQFKESFTHISLNTSVLKAAANACYLATAAGILEHNGSKWLSVCLRAMVSSGRAGHF